MALDFAMRKFARKHGINIGDISRKYDQNELLKHAGDVLWNKGLDEIGWREEPLGKYQERARAAVEEIKYSDAIAKWAKKDDPFVKHTIRIGSDIIILSLLHAMKEVGKVDATHAAVAGAGAASVAGVLLLGIKPRWKEDLEYYARKNFKYHVDDASPEEVVKTYLALKELRKREIPGSIASKIRKIYMDAMRKALEEHVKEMKKKS